MSSSVGRNSLIMASGTAASRVTGQIRTILLAWALGTTGYAANAYQAGSMIPQVIYTLVSGGIFNAVLVPQIVRTLKAEDAETKLNKLITLAITMLLGVTLLMALATPLLTRLYVNGSAETMALATSFTLWCMPQIFFYGLYTVVGQILAAKDHFTAYAWSSVGANIISCIGFGTFIALFGRATERPLDFWTPTTIALTAGTWTLGVAFQALVLFIPLTKIGLKYRPTFGIRGIGLRSMGPVAAWSIGIVCVDQIVNIISTRVATSAPFKAASMYHISQLDVAGNASYQNAYTIYMLPYSLIAVSIATAIFPKISKAVADENIAEARRDLSSSLRNLNLIMCFFAAAFVVLPVPIILALLPSISVREALLISAPLTALGIGLPFASSYLVIQRTFYAFEDGKHPFIFMAITMTIQGGIIIAATMVLPPTQWITAIGAAISISYILPYPLLARMLRSRFEGDIDDARVYKAYAKAILSAAAACAVGLLCRNGVYRLVGAYISHGDGRMNWGQAILSAILLDIIITVVYLACLWGLRTEELTSVVDMVAARIPGLAAKTNKPASPNGRLEQSTADNGDQEQQGRTIVTELKETMKPQLGDTISNRYVLVSPLREETGLQVWKASDHVLARDCQLFIVNNRKALQSVNETASMLAISHDAHFTQVLQLQHVDDVALVITQLDAGMSLTEYLASSNKPLTFTAMRSILGEVIEALHVLQKDNLTHFSISTDTVRLTRSGVEIADAPISIMLADTSRAQSSENRETLAIRQVAALLYAMLTRTPSTLSTNFRLDAIAQSVPMEFRVICKRGLNLREEDGIPTVPMATIAELEALLGDYKPLAQLGGSDIALPSADGECSIVNVPLLQILEQDTIALPDTLAAAGSIPEMTFEAPEPHTDFSDSKEALAKGMAATGGAVKSLWNNSREILSEEDIDGSSESADSPFSFPIRVSVPSQGYQTDDSQLEKTGRIPVIGPDGRVIEPGEESARALQAEQEAIEQAYQNEASATPPPSFAPQNASSGGPADVADAKLFGSLKTKVVAIVVAVILVAAAAGLAIHGLTQKSSHGTNTTANNPWPEMNLDDVPFGDNENSGDSTTNGSDSNGAKDSSGNDSSSSDTKQSDDQSKQQSSKPKKESKKKTVDKVVTADKVVKQVPDPKVPENTTPYEIDNRQFLSNPDGQRGYAYYIHLSQPQKAYRMTIKIRSSGGQGYLRVNATSSPNQGEQVAQFEFDASGTTDIKFDKVVETQDILLWVPFDSLPGNQLYIDSVQVF